MKGLFLYGASCTIEVWQDLKKYLGNIDIEFIEYPYQLTKEAQEVSHITKWVYEKYKHQKFDFIVGHSMGGIIALELVSEFNFNCHRVIFIESNLKPAKEFYRNLMMEANMHTYGSSVIDMIKKEGLYYNAELKKSLQEDFDYSDYVRKYNGKIYGIYGDRGVGGYENRISDLCLESEVIQKIKFYFVKNSCHMPMIENPEDLGRILNEILRV